MSSGREDGGEFLTGVITGAALLLLLLVATAFGVRTFRIGGAVADLTMFPALILNIALVLFCWSRHRMLARRAVVLTNVADRMSNDALTGFLNRRGISEEGSKMLARAQRRHKAMAMLLLDLDHFKTVNDMHGHVAGDALLCQVAALIDDAMPSTALTARLGSDEFACAFLFDSSHPDIVDRIAQQLVARLAQPLQVNDLSFHLSCSIGVARSDFDGGSSDTLMRAADIAMNAAKTSGRNRYAWFERSMETDLLQRGEMERGLREALPRREIVPFFEQQIDLTTGRLAGFEVLARWQHPQRGLVPPDLFIPIAEQTGLIGDLSLSIMRQAFTAARDWDSSLTLSVNISPWQLKDPWLAQKIIKVLTETGFAAHRLEVEITESSLFENMALAQSIIGSLKNQGIRLALDDFGTGYSSLSTLRALPFDRIKIDKSFVGSMADKPDSAAIVNAILKLGESLNLPVTAEGIEDTVIEERLRALGCGKAQGYLYGRPLDIAHVRRLLAEKRLLEHSPRDATNIISINRNAG